MKIELTDEEYELLKECLKWNLYFYREKATFPCQKEQIKKMEELNSKIKLGVKNV